MSSETIQHEFGYFGKLPTLGDFVHQHLPQDFVNAFHAWLQQAMVNARESLGEDFLTYYLNCPAWKFLMAAGVCGAQPMVGLTIPSVDRVGRYFNFTLASVLPMNCDPVTYALANPGGFRQLEATALDVLEQDMSRSQIDEATRELAPHFTPAGCARETIEVHDGYIRVSLDEPLPLFAQAGALVADRLQRTLGAFSGWWYGLEGQSSSNLVFCSGMPDTAAYQELLTLHDSGGRVAQEKNYIDRIIDGGA